MLATLRTTAATFAVNLLDGGLPTAHWLLVGLILTAFMAGCQNQAGLTHTGHRPAVPYNYHYTEQGTSR